MMPQCTGPVPPRPTWRYRRNSFHERARGRRAAMGDAAFGPQKASMTFIKAHTSKTVRQADMRIHIVA